MSYHRPIYAALFDMDGLLIDSEPLWDRAEMDIFSTLDVDLTRRHTLPDTLGLRIDQTVRMWYETLPWTGPSQQEITQRIITRVMELIATERPLLPGVESALRLCKQQGLKTGLVSASPLFMLEAVLEMFNLRPWFDVLSSAENLPYSKPHPQVYLNAAEALGIDPLNCVALEDSVNGMVASKAARMRAIVVPAAVHQENARWALADVKLSNLTQLMPAHLLG